MQAGTHIAGAALTAAVLRGFGVDEITTEVDRYISWPAQALSYKLGEIAIVRLRAQAEKELGDKFDIKGFHDTLLKQGSVPLPVLEQQIQAYIAERKKA